MAITPQADPMHFAFRFGLFAIIVSLILSGGAEAQTPEAFYKGKTIDMMVGSEAGSGYDAYARLVANHFNKHIPGRPAIVVKQMIGAGGIVATNYLAKIAAKDGSVIAQVQNTVPFQPLIAPGGEQFDATKLSYIGSANSEVALAFTWHTSPTKTLADLQQRETIMAGVIGSISANYAYAMTDLAGAKIRLITGYAGAGQSMLALERGEIEGYPAFFWSTFKTTKPDWIAQKKVNLLVQLALKKHPELSDVPLIFDYLDKPDDRIAAELLLAPQLAGRPFIAPPDIPNDRLSALRNAFKAMMSDTEFQADAAKRNMEVQLVSGEEIADVVKRAYATKPEIVARVRKLSEPR
jgi:tripartite-type tricarboxylate transporter receptor subunit TctC